MQQHDSAGIESQYTCEWGDSLAVSTLWFWLCLRCDWRCAASWLQAVRRSIVRKGFFVLEEAVVTEALYVSVMLGLN